MKTKHTFAAVLVLLTYSSSIERVEAEGGSIVLPNRAIGHDIDEIQGNGVMVTAYQSPRQLCGAGRNLGENDQDLSPCALMSEAKGKMTCKCKPRVKNSGGPMDVSDSFARDVMIIADSPAQKGDSAKKKRMCTCKPKVKNSAEETMDASEPVPKDVATEDASPAAEDGEDGSMISAEGVTDANDSFDKDAMDTGDSSVDKDDSGREGKKSKDAEDSVAEEAMDLDIDDESRDKTKTKKDSDDSVAEEAMDLDVEGESRDKFKNKKAKDAGDSEAEETNDVSDEDKKHEKDNKVKGKGVNDKEMTQSIEDRAELPYYSAKGEKVPLSDMPSDSPSDSLILSTASDSPTEGNAELGTNSTPSPTKIDSLLGDDWSADGFASGSENLKSQGGTSSISAGAAVGLAIGGTLSLAAVAAMSKTPRGNAIGRMLLGDNRLWHGERPASPLASEDEVTADLEVAGDIPTELELDMPPPTPDVQERTFDPDVSGSEDIPPSTLKM